MEISLKMMGTECELQLTAAFKLSDVCVCVCLSDVCVLFPLCYLTVVGPIPLCQPNPEHPKAAYPL